MNKTGIVWGNYKNEEASVDYHLKITFTDGKVTDMEETSSGTHYSSMPAITVSTPEKLSNHKISVSGSSFPIKATAGDTLDEYGYLTDGRTVYVDFDGPYWIFDDPDSPTAGATSEVSFTVLTK